MPDLVGNVVIQGSMSMSSVARTFELAVRFHRAGNLHQAELLYRQILQIDPQNADALHLVGVIAHQVGRNDVAIDYMQQALRLHPEFPEVHNNLGTALAAQGRLEEAVASYQHSLRLKPHQADAYYNLGNALKDQRKVEEAIGSYQQALRLKPDFAEAYNNLGIVLKDQGKLEEAITSYQQALRLKPDHAGAHNNLGTAFKDQGKLEEAITHFQQALRLKPDHAGAHNNLGNALNDQGKLEEAIPHFQQALRLQPDLAEAYNNLGTVLKEQGRFEEAITRFQQALRLQPDFAEAYNNLGNALKDQGKLDEAITNYQQALRLQPNLAEAYYNLGIVLKDQGKLDEAITSYQQALRLRPDHAGAHNNLGTVLKDQGKLEEAVTSYQQALRLQPDHAGAHNNLGTALKDQGKLEEAITSFQQALRLQPDFAEAYNNLGNALKDQGKLDEAITSYQQALRLQPDLAGAHSNLVFILSYHPDYDSVALYRETRRWNDQQAEQLARFRQPHANTVAPERRLRIGYVSPDFHNHPVAYSLMPLLSNHDHRQVEIFCYAEVIRPDDMTERLRACADVWRTTAGLTDEQMADMVRQDRIDILVDLALHSANNRLLVFARKPAPVQVSWMGYPGSTGLSTIDYRLTDPYLDPPGAKDSGSSEQALRLPDTFWCYDPQGDQPLVNDLPALTSGFITFGCLNNFSKVNDGVLLLWAKVLGAVPQARLLLLAPRGQARDHVLGILRQQGIDEPRVEFADRQPRQQYLRNYNRIDLGLDLLPYNGHTTSLDAFWMGVPTITLIGKTVVGRAGWSQLCNLDLRELAARTPEEYVALAVQLAGDLPRLQEMRATLRGRMRASPLMDASRFAHHMEQAYRQMWRTWCQQSEEAKKAEA